jgi:hypothetical protein
VVLSHSSAMETRDLEHLPRAYRIGLLLRDLGADDDLIGECLEIDPAGVSTLIEIGRHKLAAGHGLGQQIDGPDSDDDSAPVDG